jgi:hypothetical protein
MSQEETKTNPESTSSAQPAQPSVPVWERPVTGVPEVYSDYFHANWMPATVRIRFGQIIPSPHLPPDKTTWTVGECADVTIPWITVKALTDTLSVLIQAFEKENGPIVIPKIPAI